MGVSMKRWSAFLLAGMVLSGLPGAARALPQKATPEPRSTASPPAHALTPFVGHRVTRKVHRASCEWAEKIADENRAGFATWKEAQAAGYVACGKCKPDIKALAAEPPAAGELCASLNGKTFHKPDCAWAKKISGRNMVVYKTRDDAIASGKTPCKACKP
jgi:methylphosphotriester-DNA--protein-cysteine methyltransferase